MAKPIALSAWLVPYMILAGCASKSAAFDDAPSATPVNYSLLSEATLFLSDGGFIFIRNNESDESSEQITWSQQPTPGDIENAYPSDLDGGAYGVVRCSAGPNNSLTGCEPDFPLTKGYEAAFVELAEGLRLPANSPPANEIDYIMVQMHLSDGGKWRPCPGAPFCTITPAPPPPPPKQKGRSE